ncbi:MAG: hypothetical protein ACREQ5_14795 [Candidatus Dormibacteria bacterium]
MLPRFSERVAGPLPGAIRARPRDRVSSRLVVIWVALLLVDHPQRLREPSRSSGLTPRRSHGHARCSCAGRSSRSRGIEELIDLGRRPSATERRCARVGRVFGGPPRWGDVASIRWVVSNAEAALHAVQALIVDELASALH